ncbi:MAG TPA: hypothetical protein VNH53_08720 [Sphingomicrobium sp.]|jgi:hypothetical protein|nr:hypothetical protein [Sphingomicrobium sp.]
MTTSPFDWAEFEAEALDPANHIAFEPVPRQRRRRTGWSPERQRMFLFALSRCGSVARAARSVGMSARSAYRLLHAPGADDFARAWDEALDQGLARLRSEALEQALGGAFVPVFRRGKLVRVEHRRCDRLALALLAGKRHDIEDALRRTAVSRREYWAEVRAFDEEKAEKQRRAEAIWAEHQAILDRIEAEKRKPGPPSIPRITRL